MFSRAPHAVFKIAPLSGMQYEYAIPTKTEKVKKENDCGVERNRRISGHAWVGI
jgi:hypothetical protein